MEMKSDLSDFEHSIGHARWAGLVITVPSLVLTEKIFCEQQFVGRKRLVDPKS